MTALDASTSAIMTYLMRIAAIWIALMVASHLARAAHVEGVSVHRIAPIAAVADATLAQTDVVTPAGFDDRCVRITCREEIPAGECDAEHRRAGRKSAAKYISDPFPGNLVGESSEPLDVREILWTRSRDIDGGLAVCIADLERLRAARAVPCFKTDSEPAPPAIFCQDCIGEFVYECGSAAADADAAYKGVVVSTDGNVAVTGDFHVADGRSVRCRDIYSSSLTMQDRWLSRRVASV